MGTGERAVSPQELKRRIRDGAELAILDVREEGVFARGHLFYAVPLPLSRLELRLASLVPRRDTRIVLIDAGDRVLATMDERLGQIAAKRLSEQRVELRLRTLVSEIGSGVVRTRQGEELRANTIIWAGGVRTTPLVASLALAQNKGRLVVDDTFRVGGRDDLFAIGDAAYVENRGRPLGQLAQVAVLEAPALAANLVRLLRGEPTLPYRHKEKGDLVALGRTQAGARLRRFGPLTAPRDVVFAGFPAWTVWRVNYLMQLLGAHNRASLLSEWLLSYFTIRMVSNTP
jgi:NADH dehydrogenase